MSHRELTDVVETVSCMLKARSRGLVGVVELWVSLSLLNHAMRTTPTCQYLSG